MHWLISLYNMHEWIQETGLDNLLDRRMPLYNIDLDVVAQKFFNKKFYKGFTGK